MVIYEVNLKVAKEIYKDYYPWLVLHMEDMLKIEGFRQAEIAKEKIEDPNHIHLTVRYQVKSEKDLENYFQNHATMMRADAIKKFGDKFSATRRVFTEFVAC